MQKGLFLIRSSFFGFDVPLESIRAIRQFWRTRLKSNLAALHWIGRSVPNFIKTYLLSFLWVQRDFLIEKYFRAVVKGEAVRANLTKCSHERTRRCVIILIEAAARRLWSRFRKQLVQYSGTPWEPMNSPTCPVSSTNPVTDDIICIVGVTGGELVAGAHTVSHWLGS